MEKVLFVNACAREESRTRMLAQEVLKKLGKETEEVNLFKEEILPLNQESLKKRNRLLLETDFSASMFRYARQFAAANEIVIAAPYWDLAFPSVLRVYLEHVTVTGLTFKYSPEGIPVGLCQARRIIYVTTAGGPILDQNLGYDYVKALAGTFYGIPEVLCFKAENLDIVGADVEGILQEAIWGIRSVLL
ncbi:MAG: NAD(P)H-dependent oxidoreductase [Ruminococcus sp.]|jgi:FMN-dependent NADH-azoreductase